MAEEQHSPFPENKLDTLGLFSWNPSASGESLGRADDSSHIHGRQFTTRPAKAGLGPDVTFSRFTSIHVGDTFVSPEERRRAYDKEKRTHRLSTKPFKPTSPPQRPSGHGNFEYGVFQKYENMKASDQYDKGKTFKPKQPPRNFFTSPAKQGTYGNIGLNIGGKLDGVVGELGYVASPPMPKPQQRPASVQHTRGFQPSSPPRQGGPGYVGTNLGGSPYGSFGEYGYVSDGRYSSPGGVMKNSKYAMAMPVRPFVPSSPPKFGSGVHGCIGKYPESAPDSDVERFEIEKTAKMMERSKAIGGVFRPAGVPKSTRSPSVLNMKANQYRKNW